MITVAFEGVGVKSWRSPPPLCAVEGDASDDSEVHAVPLEDGA